MAVLKDLGVIGNGILAPMHKNRWIAGFKLKGGGDGEVLRVQVVTIDRPKIGFDKIVLDRYNTRSFIAGKYTWDPINVTFESDLGGMVVEALQKQMEIQENIIAMTESPTMKAAPGGEVYKFGMSIQQLDGSKTGVLESWLLDGCWFERIDYSDLDYAASETVKIQCTISYDHARQDIAGKWKKMKAHDGVGTKLY